MFNNAIFNFSITEIQCIRDRSGKEFTFEIDPDEYEGIEILGAGGYGVVASFGKPINSKKMGESEEKEKNSEENKKIKNEIEIKEKEEKKDDSKMKKDEEGTNVISEDKKESNEINIKKNGNEKRICIPPSKAVPKYSEEIAIKKISNVFENSDTTKDILRELTLLNFVNHKKVVKVLSFLVPEHFQDIYIVMEKLPTNLDKIIRQKNDYRKDPSVIPYIIYQITRGIYYLHSSKIMHRDIKPKNILIDEKAMIKICDFGKARMLNSEKEYFNYTGKIRSLYYQAPETLIGSKNSKLIYNEKVDLWGLGCIMAELYLKKTPLFVSRGEIKDNDNQLLTIFKILGKPKEDILLQLFERENKKLYDKIKNIKEKDISEAFPTIKDNNALDLLKKLFEINPDKRISALDVLKHPYFDDIRVEKHLLPSKSIFECKFEEEIEKLEADNSSFEAKKKFYEKEIKKFLD